MTRQKIVALVSAFNQAGLIGQTVEALKKVHLVTRVVVVDDGSKDSTTLEAKKAGAEVIVLPHNVGKGGALNRALQDLNYNYDVLLLIDGDLGEAAAQAEKLLQLVLNGRADMAVADFPKPSRKGGFGLVKGLARWGIRRWAGLEVKEPLSGQRALRLEVMKKIGKLDGGFGVEVGLTIDTIQAGFRVVEVPTTMSHTETGRDLPGFLHRGKQFLAVARVLMRRLGRK